MMDMLPEEVIKYRLVSSEKYVKLLGLSLNQNWAKLYKTINKIEFIEDRVIYKLVLLHPKHFDEFIGAKNIDNKIKIIQGQRIFKSFYDDSECQSELFWGYKCPFSNVVKVFDHAFPYSLGGPTNEAHNKRVLCKWHNMVKANDIHNYHWERLTKEYKFYHEQKSIHWIDEQLKKIIHEFNIKI